MGEAANQRLICADRRRWGGLCFRLRAQQESRRPERLPRLLVRRVLRSSTSCLPSQSWMHQNRPWSQVGGARRGGERPIKSQICNWDILPRDCVPGAPWPTLGQHLQHLPPTPQPGAINAVSIFQTQEVHFTHVGLKRRCAPGLWCRSGGGSEVV